MYHHKILKIRKAQTAASSHAVVVLDVVLCTPHNDTKPTHNNTHLVPTNAIAMNTNTKPNTLCDENILLLTKEEARE